MNILSNKWKKRCLRMAYQAAAWSKDDSSQVGAYIVNDIGSPKSLGFNGMARGVNDNIPERHERPEKYYWMIHAEFNSILLSERSLKDCIIFITHTPCDVCANAIIQAGITHVVVDKNNGINSQFGTKETYKYKVQKSQEILKESGIHYEEVDSDVTLEKIDEEWFVIPKSYITPTK